MKRQALLVLGMHRTGTSALTGMLVSLGVTGPRTIYPTDKHNPRGYWESDQLHRFHERLLLAARTSWEGWTPVDPAWLAPETPFIGELRQLVDEEYGASPLFVVKDPRICRLVPSWLTCLDAVTIDAKVIITLRSPGEVAASLATRDGIATAPALLAWLRHVLDAEQGTRHLRRSFVPFHDLLADWRAVADRLAVELGVSWPSDDRPRDEIAGFVDPGLRHHEAGIPDVGAPIGEWLRRTVAALDLLVRPNGTPLSEAWATLDEVRAQLDDAGRLFAVADESARHDWRARAVDAEAAQAELARRLTGLTEEVDAWRDRAETIDAERTSLGRRVADLDADLVSQRRQIEGLNLERDDLRRGLEEVEADRESLRQQVVDRGALRHQVADLGRALAEARHHIDAMLSSYSWRVTAPGRMAVGWLRRGPVRSARDGDEDTRRGA